MSGLVSEVLYRNVCCIPTLELSCEDGSYERPHVFVEMSGPSQISNPILFRAPANITPTEIEKHVTTLNVRSCMLMNSFSSKSGRLAGLNMKIIEN